ncbi:HNH endonuclease signature motif containing protein [Prochlorococcus sp. MIT 1223]|uniref:HNH endonuclease signature motif containing protein n=1 Tax=Prochlorococcus sp. MIT 1223 TaxID=3096217 RepID=UPI002A763F19|nr:HNH endonuclease [Prochlorococcus sp. MIT 1223]
MPTNKNNKWTDRWLVNDLANGLLWLFSVFSFIAFMWVVVHLPWLIIIAISIYIFKRYLYKEEKPKIKRIGHNSFNKSLKEPQYHYKKEKSKPSNNCICGCKGIPFTHLPIGSKIDLKKHKVCPARWQRKRTGFYTNALGERVSWVSSAGQRSGQRALERQKEREEAQRQLKKAAVELQIKKELRKKEAKEARRKREENNEAALSRTEALERGLTTYIGHSCNVGHSGIRHVRNSECVECRKNDQRLRDAMRRGAYPRDLTQEEKLQITKIYKEAKFLTKATGIEHHVDHIKPLAAGGEHHPDNLQILTAKENLSKGAKWEGG